MTLSQLYHIENYIDTFAPGHYARVMAALDFRTGQTVALKVLRPEHLHPEGDMRWEYRAFGNEAHILARLADSPHIVRLLDCGFLESSQEAPDGGAAVSLGTDAAAFGKELAEQARRGWRPYLALENLPRTDNLFYLMQPNSRSLRRRLPGEEGIALALQFASLLHQAHAQRIVYLDHKLEHVYWDGQTLRVIDFNSSQQLSTETARPAEYMKDLHNLCVGVLYPLFTGMSPRKTTLLPQPGGLEALEARYQDITELDFMMEPTLSQALQALLQRGAAMQIESVEAFTQALQQVAALHGRDFPGHYTTPASRSARDKMRQGLKLLREGEGRLRQARAVMDGISEDLEDELRRLVKGVSEMLNHRVIP
ncbi:MAG: hypothetical protein MUE40_16540 [Anaerolineae bacterium]|nr:hypothetical protein [Anaerolineae bacterium]